MIYHLEGIDFQGPLDLLLELVKANKCDIKDIFIKNIIEQYLQIIESKNDDCELASEFIVMASSLIEIKSRYFIYLNDKLSEEEDPGKELYELLEEYKKYKELAAVLGKMYEEGAVQYTNKGQELLIEESVDFSNYTIIDIFAIYSRFLKESKKEPRANLISFKKISVEEKIIEIEKILESIHKVYFNKIVNGKLKDDVVASLLGVLELSKEQKIQLSQRRVFENILIERVSNGN